MELNLSTLLFEVINFLILLWLLKRFLYQPVLNAIDRRRQKIAAELAQAASDQEEAQTLKQQYEERLLDWETEKRQAKDVLSQEINEVRVKRLQALEQEQLLQQQKNLKKIEQQQNVWRQQAEVEALQLGGAFASRLLTSLTCAELEGRLLALFVQQLSHMPETTTSKLKAAQPDQVEVISAQPLNEDSKTTLRQAFEQKLGLNNVAWNFREDESLIAGLRISLAGWSMAANLQDELRFFNQAALTHD